MKTSSCNIDPISGMEYCHYRDKFNVSRKMFLKICKICSSGQWISARPKKNIKGCNKCLIVTLTEEQKKKISVSLKNKYSNPEYKKRILNTFNPKKGKDHWNWQGGSSTEREAIMKTDLYKNWRRSVFERDNYKCKLCGKGGNIHAHHIIPYAVDKSKFNELKNGITLCPEHHKLIHKYYREVCHQN